MRPPRPRFPHPGAILAVLAGFAPLFWLIEQWPGRYFPPANAEAFLRAELAPVAVFLAAPLCLLMLGRRC